MTSFLTYTEKETTVTVSISPENGWKNPIFIFFCKTRSFPLNFGKSFSIVSLFPNNIPISSHLLSLNICYKNRQKSKTREK